MMIPMRKLPAKVVTHNYHNTYPTFISGKKSKKKQARQYNISAEGGNAFTSSSRLLFLLLIIYKITKPLS